MALLFPVPLALIEFAAARAALRGRRVDPFGRVWIAAFLLLPVAVAQHAYAASLPQGVSFERAMAEAARGATSVFRTEHPLHLAEL